MGGFTGNWPHLIREPRPQFVFLHFQQPQSVWLMMMNSCVSSR